jgi:hypothetical protein
VVAVLVTDPLTALLIAALQILAGVAFGASAAARYNQSQAAKQKEATTARVVTAMEADVKRSLRIAEHNVTLSGFQPDAPRPYIHFPVDTYELVLFRGEYATLVREPALNALMDYLHQARHVNAMIGLFEQIEVTFGGTEHSVMGPKKKQYVQEIGNYCRDAIPPLLTALDAALTPTTTQHVWWRFWQRAAT